MELFFGHSQMKKRMKWKKLSLTLKKNILLANQKQKNQIKRLNKKPNQETPMREMIQSTSIKNSKACLKKNKSKLIFSREMILKEFKSQEIKQKSIESLLIYGETTLKLYYSLSKKSSLCLPKIFFAIERIQKLNKKSNILMQYEQNRQIIKQSKLNVYFLIHCLLTYLLTYLFTYLLACLIIRINNNLFVVQVLINICLFSFKLLHLSDSPKPQYQILQYYSLFYQSANQLHSPMSYH